ncbi:RimK family alpha-L-glutamate ligase [Candidatus Peregrinibacteria bacterium]|nr:RimK family alpha-L-glutamate ligase [Candidatus Peregrinibacteria bacterium]
MKIGILSFISAGKRAEYEEIRLKKEAQALGHTARIFRANTCQLVYDRHHPSVLYDGQHFPHYDVMIPRVRLLKDIELRTAVVKQLQLMKVPMFNRYSSICRAKNKLRTLQILDHEDIPIPKTLVVHGPEYVDDAVKKVGGLPVILKSTAGSYGAGVVIAESKRAVHSALDALIASSWNNLILIQEYVKEARGSDTRVFVVSGKVIGAMRRQAKRGEFRSNMELGGDAVAVSPSSEMTDIALQATKALNLQVAGVDIIQTKRGPAVMEVNANPGFKGLEEATGFNIAREIIQSAVVYAKRQKAKREK